MRIVRMLGPLAGLLAYGLHVKVAPSHDRMAMAMPRDTHGSSRWFSRASMHISASCTEPNLD